MDDAAFYAAVAAMLGADDAYRPNPFPYRTRWNNRAAGNGRFEGFGIVRRFGGKVHVALRRPIVLTAMFDTAEEALDAMKHLLAGEEQTGTKPTE